MKELIKITTNEQGVNCVSARELHEGLKVSQRFNDWITRRISKYGFEENIDYVSFTQNGVKPQGGRPQQDYIITVDMAKELCMVENNDLGRQFRKYFIECEKQLREIKTTPSYQIEDPISRAKRWIEEEEERQRLVAENKELEEFTSVITVSDDCISLRKFAQLSSESFGFGLKKLCSVLRELKILRYEGGDNVPYQRFLNSKYFEVEEVNRHGHLHMVTRITPKGQKWLTKKLNEWKEAQEKAREIRLAQEETWGVKHSFKEVEK